jgi:hypothetical protein
MRRDTRFLLMQFRFSPNMFRQIIAIIRGVEVPWKLLRHGLYYECVWITIRPVWLVVGRCSQACTRLADVKYSEVKDNRRRCQVVWSELLTMSNSCCSQGQPIIWQILKPIVKLLRPRTGLANVSEGACISGG